MSHMPIEPQQLLVQEPASFGDLAAFSSPYFYLKGPLSDPPSRASP